MIIDYASYDSIRAVLGVSQDEIEDSTIDLPLYEVLLSEDLRGMYSTLEADYHTVRAVATPSAAETRFVKILQTYAAYQVAYTLLGSVIMFAPKNISDGKASVERVDKPFAVLDANVSRTLSYVRDRLLDAYQAYNPIKVAPATVTRSMIVSTSLSDPVTG
jgi:hypothetical protein